MVTPGRRYEWLRRAGQWLTGADVARAVRATTALMIVLLLARAGRLPVEASFAAIAAHSMCLTDVRGAYSVRFPMLLAMALVLAGSAALGAVTAASLPAALAATALIAATSALWRHLSPEYGPSLATPASLVFYMALAAPQSGHPGHHGLSVLAGALLGVGLHVALWPVRAQHPLRRVAAESWLAVADLAAALAPAPPGYAFAPAQRVAALESGLRATLDSTYAVLQTAGSAYRPFPAALEALHVVAARLATRLSALHATLEAIAGRAGAGRSVAACLAPSLSAAMEALENAARSVAVAVVSRQPAGMVLSELRLRRAANLLRGLAACAEGDAAGTAAGGGDAEGGREGNAGSDHLLGVVRSIEAQLPEAAKALEAVTARARERSAFSPELFDLHARMLRPLAASLNLRPRFEPAIVRYAARIGVLTMLGVLVLYLGHFRHGYWLPFTAVVVMQPDYGATRRKALQRVGGTLAGGVLASGLLFLHLSPAAALAAVAGTSLLFAYFLRRHYGVAVVFITLFVVLLTEGGGGATVTIAAERLALTAAGGAMALAAALVFWPAWERDRLPPLLASALRANRDFLLTLSACLARGGAYGGDVVRAKRRAESANTETFASLQRLFADPASRRYGAEQAAVLANGNQRLTRALNVLFSEQTADSPPVRHPALARFTGQAAEALSDLAARVENAHPAASSAAPPEPAQLPLPEVASVAGPGAGREGGAPGADGHEWRVFAQLARAGAELRAMRLTPPPAPPADRRQDDVRA